MNHFSTAKAPAADVIQRLVVVHDGHICVLQQGVDAKDLASSLHFDKDRLHLRTYKTAAMAPCVLLKQSSRMEGSADDNRLEHTTETTTQKGADVLNSDEAPCCTVRPLLLPPGGSTRP